MKFLTKEWSQQMSKKGFLLSSPQVTPQAAAFSEPFYQTLYQEAQQKHLDLMRKVAALRRKPFQAEREAEQFRQTHQRRGGRSCASSCPRKFWTRWPTCGCWLWTSPPRR